MRRLVWMVLVIATALSARSVHAQCNPLLTPSYTQRTNLCKPTPGQCEVVECLDESIDRLDAILCGAGLTCDLGIASVNAPSDLASTLCDNTNNILKKVNGSWTCAPDSGTGGSAGVLTFNGRDGVVTPEEGDYTLALLDDVTNKEGNSTVVQMFAGSVPNTDDCAKFDVNHNIVTAGFACGSGGGGAPTNASYITQKSETGLDAEQSLGGLGSAGTYLLKNTIAGSPPVGTLSDYAGSTNCADTSQVVDRIFADGSVHCVTPGGTGVSDHGLLNGLTDDDHPQYVLRAGRTGTTNDFTVATSDSGTIAGSSGTGGLVLKGNTATTTGKTIQLNPHWTSVPTGLPYMVEIAPQGLTADHNMGFLSLGAVSGSGGTRAVVTTSGNNIEMIGIQLSPAITPASSSTGQRFVGIDLGPMTRPADGTAPTWTQVVGLYDFGRGDIAGTTGGGTVTDWDTVDVQREQINVLTTITNSRGLRYRSASWYPTNDFAVDVESINNKTGGTPGLGGALRMSYATNTARWGLLGTGTVKHFLRGSLRLGDASPPTTASVTQPLEVLGNVYLDNSTTSGELRFREINAGAYYTGFRAPDITAGLNLMYVLPPTAPTVDQVLAADTPAGGVYPLKWVTGTGGGGYATIQDEGTPRTQRTVLNFAGGGVDCQDDTNRTTCTIGTASPTGYQTIKDAGGTEPQRTVLKFDGSITCADVSSETVCTGTDTAGSGFTVANDTYTIAGADQLFRWDDNGTARGRLTLGTAAAGYDQSSEVQNTPALKWAGDGSGYQAMLTRGGGYRAGVSGLRAPPIPRSAYLQTGEYFSPVPPNLRYWTVSGPGVTAATQPSGAVFPSLWEPYMPFALNDLVYNGPAENFIYKITSASTLTHACSFNGVRAPGPDSGSCCITGPTSPTFCTTLGCTTTTTDGDCKYVAVAATTDDSITDGGVTFTQAGGFNSHLSKAVVSINPGTSLYQNKFEVQVGDNESGGDFILGRVDLALAGSQRNFDGTNEFAWWLIHQGESRYDLATENVFTQSSHTGLSVMQANSQSYPRIPPTVTWGASGPVNSLKCFGYAWEDKITGGRTTLSPWACTFPSNKIVNIQVSGFTWPSNARAIIYQGDPSDNAWARIGRIENSGGTLSSSDFLTCYGAGPREGMRCAQHSDCPSCSNCCVGISEHEYGYKVNNTGSPIFSARPGAQFGPTWQAYTTWGINEFARPTVPNGSTYQVDAAGCTTDCVTCDIINNGYFVPFTTAGTEPDWSVAMLPGKTTCESGTGVAATCTDVRTPAKCCTGVGTGNCGVRWRNAAVDQPSVMIAQGTASNTRDLLTFKEARESATTAWRTISGVNSGGAFYVNKKTATSWWIKPALRMSSDADGGGKIEFGPGGATAPDVVLQRDNTITNALDVTDGGATASFLQLAKISTGGQIAFGLGGSFDLRFTRTGGHTLALVGGTAAPYLGLLQNGQTSFLAFSRDASYTAGRIDFGSGSGAMDVNFFRREAGVLGTTGTLALIGPGGSPAAYTGFKYTGSTTLIYSWPTTAPTTDQVLKAGAPSGGVYPLSWTTGGGGGGAMTCAKVTIGEAALTTASNTEDEAVVTLPANAKMYGVTIKHTQAFAGSFSGMTVSVGVSADPTYYAPTFDVYQAPGAGIYLDSGPQYKSYGSASHDVIARFTSTGAFVNTATAGSVDIRYCYVALP